MTRFARLAQSLPGNFAEFGTIRGRLHVHVLGTSPSAAFRLFLFDTFGGTPSERLAEDERAMAGDLADTCRSRSTRSCLASNRATACARGDVFDTLPRVETGDRALVHMDLNAAAPTIHALEYAYPRLVPGAAVVFDDYGWSKYRASGTPFTLSSPTRPRR